jgi:hypothetical protein
VPEVAMPRSGRGLFLPVVWMILAACSGYGDTRRALYDSSLSEYKRTWSRHRAQAARHGELTRDFDEAKARGASTDELTRYLGAMWEILRSDGLTLVEVSEREKSREVFSGVMQAPDTQRVRQRRVVQSVPGEIPGRTISPVALGPDGTRTLPGCPSPSVTPVGSLETNRGSRTLGTPCFHWWS